MGEEDPDACGARRVTVTDTGCAHYVALCQIHNPAATAAVSTPRRWACFPHDQRSHLLAECGTDQIGALVGVCGDRMVWSVPTHAQHGGRSCPTCEALAPVSGTGTLSATSASTLLGVMLLVAGGGLLTVGVLGWRRRLPRNRFAGVRTLATLRSDTAFIAANRVAAPPVLAAGAICAAGGVLSFRTGGAVLAMIVGVAGTGAIGLLLAGGLLGHRAATAVPPPTGGGDGCACSGGGLHRDLTRRHRISQRPCTEVET